MEAAFHCHQIRFKSMKLGHTPLFLSYLIYYESITLTFPGALRQVEVSCHNVVAEDRLQGSIRTASRGLLSPVNY